MNSNKLTLRKVLKIYGIPCKGRGSVKYVKCPWCNQETLRIDFRLNHFKCENSYGGNEHYGDTIDFICQMEGWREDNHYKDLEEYSEKQEYRKQWALERIRKYLEQDKGKKSKLTTTFMFDEMKREIWEQVYSPVDGHRFVHYCDTRGARVELVDEFIYNDITYSPVEWQPIEAGYVKLAEKPLAYDNELELYEQIKAHLKKYIQFPREDHYMLCTAYVMFSWLYDRFKELPFLRFLGDYNTGKTRMTQAVGGLCYRSMSFGSGATLSPIFRITNTFHCSKTLDEAQSKFKEKFSEWTDIFNSSMSRENPIVRTEKIRRGELVPMVFDIFSPLVLNSRVRFSSTALESRCLTIKVKRLREDEIAHIQKNLDNRYETDAMKLRNKLLMWRLSKYFVTQLHPEEEVKGASSRLNQILIPLLSTIESKSVKNQLKNYVKDYDKEITALRSDSLEGIIIDVVSEQLKKASGNKDDGFNHLNMTKILELVREQSGLKNMSSTLLGRRLNDLGVDKIRVHKGRMIPFSDKNIQTITELRKAYGLPVKK